MSNTKVVTLKRRVRRVVWTGDFLRFRLEESRFYSSQTGNTAWLRQIMTSGEAWRRGDLELRSVFPGKGSLLEASTPGEHEALTDYQDDPESAWARRYDAQELDIFHVHLEALAQADLVVGFEMPPTLKRLLHRQGVPYVSFHIHALRFLRDLSFGASTNCSRIAHALEAFVLPLFEVTSQVQHHRALCQVRQLPLFALPPDVPVLIGQTARDSVLIQNGQFESWAQHRERTHELLRDHDAVIFLPHPYRANSLEIAEELRLQHGKTVISTDANGYALLLSNTRIPFVMTLASSLGVEAEAMGLGVHYVLGDPRDRLRVPDVDLGPREPLTHGVMTDAFWAALLGGAVKARSQARPPGLGSYTMGDSFLRTSLDAWSYGLLQRGLAGATNQTVVFPASQTSPGRMDDLIHGIGHAESDQVAKRGAVPPWQTSGIVLQVVDQPLGPGSHVVVDIAHRLSTVYLAEGFHAPEHWGVWTNASKARIRIPLSPRAADTVLRIALTISCPLPARFPVVRISSGGRTLGFAFFRPSQPKEQRVEILVDACLPATGIDLEVSGTICPADEGWSADRRQLGLGLHTLEIACEPASAHTKPPEQACRGPVLVGIGRVPDPQSKLQRQTNVPWRMA